MKEVLITAVGSLVWLVAMFVPLERAFSARPEQRIFRHGFATDVAFFLGQYLLFAGLAATAISALSHSVEGAGITTTVRDMFAGRHPVVQVALVLILGDFCAYWGHRAQHRFGWLWRFHAVHHTSTEVDWLAAHREHPLDGLYTQTLVNLPAILLGFDLGAVMGLVAFRGLWAVFIHSNVRLPLGPLRYLVGSPQLHRWHHAKMRDAGNYANLAPWLDVLFGTYREEEEPLEMGIDEPIADDYLGLLVRPLLFGSGPAQSGRLGAANQLRPVAAGAAGEARHDDDELVGLDGLRDV